jgi:hypothetical protein
MWKDNKIGVMVCISTFRFGYIPDNMELSISVEVVVSRNWAYAHCVQASGEAGGGGPLCSRGLGLPHEVLHVRHSARSGQTLAHKNLPALLHIQ